MHGAKSVMAGWTSQLMPRWFCRQSHGVSGEPRLGRLRVWVAVPLVVRVNEAELVMRAYRESAIGCMTWAVIGRRARLSLMLLVGPASWCVDRFAR